MKKNLMKFSLFASVLVLVWSLNAITTTSNLTINATVSARASLTISTNNITFPAADPDTTSSIEANENPVTVTCKGQTSQGSTITLTCRAQGDLVEGGGASIDIDNVTWTHTGSGYQDGTMSTSTDVSVGSWTNSGNRSGDLYFYLANSWSYNVGSYSATVVYTLTVP